jgi:ABC-type transport system involved in multi-copper enzyme maturation permease subunit
LELVAGGGLLLATAIAWWSLSGLSLLQQVLLGALVVAGLAALSRRGWLRLFGPVLFYDLIRMTRRSRFFWLRFFYAAVLALVVYWQYSDWFSRRSVRPLPTGLMQTNEMALFAEQFFNRFMLLQFIAIGVLTPIYAGSAIAEEKDRKTLEFLLATDLNNREIVFSKLASRLANLTLIVMTGLPLLSLIQFLGGVDPDLVLAGFAAAAMTMVSLASLSILCSVYTRKPRDAILLTYLALVAYLGLGFLLDFMFTTPKIVPVMPRGRMMVGPPPTSPAIVDLFNAGNLPIALSKLSTAWTTGAALGNILPKLLRDYLICHALIATACSGWAVARIRAVALKHHAVPRRKAYVNRRSRLRPRIGLLPMVWKEVFVEPGFRLTLLGWVAVSVFIIISFIPGIWIAYQFFIDEVLQRPPIPWRGAGRGSAYLWTELGRQLNLWIRVTGMIISSLMLLGVAARASTSISGERDRDTMDALLASPLQSHDILFAKWLGSILSVRWAWLWIGIVWIAGLGTGSLHPYAVVLTMVAWLVYASCFAGIGLWFSTACRTTLRSTLCTLATCVAVGGGHWILWTCCLPLGGLPMVINELAPFQGALTPPVVLYWLSGASNEVGWSQEWELKTLVSYIGLFLWSFPSLFLWTITRTRFRKLTSRWPHRRAGRGKAPSFSEYPDEDIDIVQKSVVGIGGP